MRKQAFSYLARVGFQKIIGFLLYLIGAGFTLTYAGIVFGNCFNLVCGMVLDKSDFGKHFFRIYSEDSKRQKSKGLHNRTI